MKTAARNFARTAVALAAAGVIAILNGCGAAPDASEHAGTTMDELTRSCGGPPTSGAWSGTCTYAKPGGCMPQLDNPTLMAGYDNPAVSAGYAIYKSVNHCGWVSTDNDAIAQFQTAIQAAGGVGPFMMASTTKQWLGFDISTLSPAQKQNVYNIVNQYNCDPVFASAYSQTKLYECPYGTAHAYEPTDVVVYDPKGCNGCM